MIKEGQLIEIEIIFGIQDKDYGYHQKQWDHRKGEGDDWLRSNCQLVLNEAGFGRDLCSLAEAVEKSYAVADVDIESELYLNNSGGGNVD